MIKQLKDGTVMIENDGQVSVQDVIDALLLCPPDDKVMLENHETGKCSPLTLGDLIPLHPKDQTINTGLTYWVLSLSNSYEITEKDAV